MPSGFFLNVVPALLYVGAIFYGGSLPPPRLPNTSMVGADKILHLLAFAGMQIAITRAMRYEFPESRYSRVLIGAAALTSFIGLLLELWQSFIPQRSAEFVDWIADTLGAVLAALALWFLFRPRPATPLGAEE